ncbi:hypothetical protein Nos7524_3091 [Nostoc sp. PCC 7524]|uniref:hypothetical protein n=1 Tax=Nostoc sp. (strain ATCC 29411 / PCC 7524) TaxID=28072 RepID=UPI00029F1C7E|nr:hypothetical protein [Nostoc sp. PCC 7524]AFY48894.1 hypothetical protein Nos7524_3091 [Nostoc sp. PCC 7524]
MTGKPKLQNTQCNWTEAHDAYCLENKITPAAKLLWQWLIRQGIGDEQEPDLKEFNQWVEKHRGKGYTRPTLKDALAQLVDCRVVQIVKQFTWRIVRIVTRPLDWLNPKKNLRHQHKNCDSPPSKPQSADDTPNSSSNSSNDTASREEIIEVCAKAGIFYHPDKPAKVFSYSLDDVLLAIDVYKLRSAQERIRNPQGWLIDCLEWRYWEDMTLAWGGL